jgi:hypothetical protein
MVSCGTVLLLVVQVGDQGPVPVTRPVRRRLAVAPVSVVSRRGENCYFNISSAPDFFKVRFTSSFDCNIGE